MILSRQLKEVEQKKTMSEKRNCEENMSQIPIGLNKTTTSTGKEMLSPEITHVIIVSKSYKWKLEQK